MLFIHDLSLNTHLPISISQGPPSITGATSLKLKTSCPKVMQEDLSMHLFPLGCDAVADGPAGALTIAYLF